MIYSLVSDMGMMRQNNEDYCMAEVVNVGEKQIGLFALADGMGGHNKGEIASKMAVEGIIKFLKSNLIQNDSVKIDYIDDILKQSYHYVNLNIYEISKNNEVYSGMGTTLVVAVIYDEKLYVANVGDSRCYLFRKDILKKITTDHSVVESLIIARAITESQAKTHPRRNEITRAIGTNEIVLVDLFKVSLKSGDKILLASDGLTSYVDKENIKHTLMKNYEVDVLSNDLINQANQAQGRDNISVILIEQE